MGCELSRQLNEPAAGCGCVCVASMAGETSKGRMEPGGESRTACRVVCDGGANLGQRERGQLGGSYGVRSEQSRC